MSKGPHQVTIDLDWEIEAHGKTLTRLTMKRPKLGMLSNVKEDATLGDLVPVFAAMCDVPPSSIKQIDADDLPKMMQAFVGFTEKLRAIGGISAATSPAPSGGDLGTSQS